MRPVLHRAFTLIELTVALGLGLIIVLVLFAVFRSVSATLNKSNRIARDNQALRSGYIAACEELDHWRGFDDPDHAPGRDGVGDPGEQLLRSPVVVSSDPDQATAKGMPVFTYSQVGNDAFAVQDGIFKAWEGDNQRMEGSHASVQGNPFTPFTQVQRLDTGGGAGSPGYMPGLTDGMWGKRPADLGTALDLQGGAHVPAGYSLTADYPVLGATSQFLAGMNLNPLAALIFSDSPSYGYRLGGGGTLPQRPTWFFPGGLPAGLAPAPALGSWAAFTADLGTLAASMASLRWIWDPVFDRRGAQLPHSRSAAGSFCHSWLGPAARWFLAPDNDCAQPYAAPVAGVPLAEFERGHDPEGHWSAADPRTWFLGDESAMCSELTNANAEVNAEARRSNQLLGRYAMHQGAKVIASLGDLGGSSAETTRKLSTGAAEKRLRATPHHEWGSYRWEDRIPTASGVHYLVSNWGYPGDHDTSGVFGTVFTRHTWRDNQLLGLRAALGEYGYLDYLPINAIPFGHGVMVPHYTTSIDGKDHTATGEWLDVPEGIARWIWGRNPQQYYWACRTKGGVGVVPRSPWGRDMFKRDKYGGNRIPVDTTDKIPATQAALLNRLWPEVDSDERSLLTYTPLQPVQLQRPIDWPQVEYGVARFWYLTQRYDQATVRIQDPVNGTWRELSFHALGTSLRGARQQRHRDGRLGWAEHYGSWWDRTVRDTTLPANDPTLDSH